MKKLLIFTIVMLALSGIFNSVTAQYRIPFGGTLPNDTAWTNHHLRVDGVARFPFYSNSDATKFLRIDANGYFVLSTIPAQAGVITWSDTVSTVATKWDLTQINPDLSGYIKQGGDTRGVDDTIGTKDANNLVFIRENVPMFTIDANGIYNSDASATGTTNMFRADRDYVNPSTGVQDFVSRSSVSIPSGGNYASVLIGGNFVPTVDATNEGDWNGSVNSGITGVVASPQIGNGATGTIHKVQGAVISGTFVNGVDVVKYTGVSIHQPLKTTGSILYNAGLAINGYLYGDNNCHILTGDLDVQDIPEAHGFWNIFSQVTYDNFLGYGRTMIGNPENDSLHALQVAGGIKGDTVTITTVNNGTANDTLLVWDAALGMVKKYLPYASITTALSSKWDIAGNSLSALGVIGSTNSQIVELRANATRLIRLNATTPRIDIGSTLNTPTSNIVATIQGRSGSFLQFTNTTTGVSLTNDGVALGVDTILANFYIYNRENASVVFGTNNAERMRIDNLGNIVFPAIPDHSSGTLTIMGYNTTSTRLEKITSVPTAFIKDISTTAITATGGVTLSRPFTTRYVDATAGNVTITITPSEAGQVATFIRLDNSGNTITLQMASGTINGAASQTITSQYDSVPVEWNGTNAFIN